MSSGMNLEEEEMNLEEEEEEGVHLDKMPEKDSSKKSLKSASNSYLTVKKKYSQMFPQQYASLEITKDNLFKFERGELNIDLLNR